MGTGQRVTAGQGMAQAQGVKRHKVKVFGSWNTSTAEEFCTKWGRQEPAGLLVEDLACYAEESVCPTSTGVPFQLSKKGNDMIGPVFQEGTIFRARGEVALTCIPGFQGVMANKDKSSICVICCRVICYVLPNSSVGAWFCPDTCIGIRLEAGPSTPMSKHDQRRQLQKCFLSC